MPSKDYLFEIGHIMPVTPTTPAAFLHTWEGVEAYFREPVGLRFGKEASAVLETQLDVSDVLVGLRANDTGGDLWAERFEQRRAEGKSGLGAHIQVRATWPEDWDRFKAEA